VAGEIDPVSIVDEAIEDGTPPIAAKARVWAAIG
jgi:hypothetical protein